MMGNCNPGTIAHWGNACLTGRLGRLAKILREFHCWKRESQTHPTAHLGYGWSLHNQEKYDEALASYLKTVKDGIRDDTGARAQFLMGECFLEQNQHIKARTEFAKVDQLYAFPQWQSKGLFEMARSFAQEKQINEAKTVFNKLIEKYPETASARAAKEELNRLN